MTGSMHDVVIIGGGPGGLYAGWQLARAGLDVVLCEEHAAVGEPVHCTGVLGREAYEEFDLPREAILNDLTRVVFRSPGGQRVEFEPARVEAIAIDRRRFDAGLAARALTAGLQLRCGRRVADIRIEPGGVVCDVEGAPSVAARAAILACGARYGFQRRLGLGVPARLLQTAQVEVPAWRPGLVEVHVGSVTAPRGFGWVVPVKRAGGDCARVGVMCDRDAGAHFDRLLRDVTPRWELQTAAPPPRVKVLPLAPIPRTFTDRLVAIGDAAGLVKPTTGGGIYYSIVSAAAAAGVLVDALGRNDLRADRLARYERRWRRRLGRELEAQLAFRTLAERLSDPELEQLFELARSNGVLPIVRRTARFNHHRGLIVALLRYPPLRSILLRHLVA